MAHGALGAHARDELGISETHVVVGLMQTAQREVQNRQSGPM
jgi:hypothetical protein